jgi:hypothetical protein
MKSINETILTKIKKKKILIISSDENSKKMLQTRMAQHYNLTIKKVNDKEELNFDYEFTNKHFNLKCVESTGYELNSHMINLAEVSKADGIIFIFTKFSYDSLKYISDFIKNYHSAIGNKFCPSTFVQNETIYNNTHYSDSVTKKEIEELTMNGSFPLVKVKKDFEKKECNKIFNSILKEIKKEKNDDFPYSLAYQDQLKINYCIKNNKVFSFLNLLIFFFVMLFTFLDTLFILNTQDFQNEARKVDDIFLGIRLNINAINFISAIVFIKYALFDREKYVKIRRLEKFVMIVNGLSWIIQIILHLRIRHVRRYKKKLILFYFF